jgi:large subunit ribosomal protein L25
MAQAIALKAEERQGTGTGVARALRRVGKIPGIIYGGGHEPQPIAVDLKVVSNEIQKPGFFSRVYTVEMDQAKVQTKLQVIARDIQFHPVTDIPLHVDFQRVDKDSKIHVSIPVEYINEDKAPGLKLGGMLNVIVHNLEVVCPAASIPEKITIDLAGLNINQSVHLDSIELPKGVKAAHAARDCTLVTIVPPSGADEEKKSEATSAA